MRGTVSSIIVHDSTVKSHNPRPSSSEGDVGHERAGVCAPEPSGILHNATKSRALHTSRTVKIHEAFLHILRENILVSNDKILAVLLYQDIELDMRISESAIQKCIFFEWLEEVKRQSLGEAPRSRCFSPKRQECVGACVRRELPKSISETK
jgi:hypothetical protein